MNKEQKHSIIDALALYRHSIDSLNREIASESMMASNLNENGKPSKEASRAMNRIACATDLRDQLTSQRNALALAFSITL
jgi:hypothetical protein